jgi:cytochrome c peroxidase
MSLVNTAYSPTLTWAHPSLVALEEQALRPMLGDDPVELGLKGRELVFLETVRRDQVYQELFPKAFPGEGEATLSNVIKAIAAFERSIVSMRSPYDRYRWVGDASALSPAAKSRRVTVFVQREGGLLPVPWRMELRRRALRGGRGSMSRAFINTGVSKYDAPNRGLYQHTHRDEDIGKFRAPTLWNIAVTAPYMHDGSLATLEAVIDHYAAGGRMRHINKHACFARSS